MNIEEDTTAAAPRKAPMDMTWNDLELSRMTPCELRGIACAVRTLLDVGTGLVAQPRFIRSDMNYTAAGNMLECLNESLGALLDALYGAVERCSPTSSKEVETLAWCRLDLKARWSEGLEDLAVTAAESVRDFRAAEFQETLARAVTR